MFTYRTGSQDTCYIAHAIHRTVYIGTYLNTLLPIVRSSLVLMKEEEVAFLKRNKEFF